MEFVAIDSRLASSDGIVEQPGEMNRVYENILKLDAGLPKATKAREIVECPQGQSPITIR